MSLLIGFHVLSATVWVGGMFFAYLCLRPVAAALLEAPQRLAIWHGVFKRFFFWVWMSIGLLIISGHGVIAEFGGMGMVGLHVHIMLALGYLMIAIFGHLFFVPYKRLGRAVIAAEWPEAAKHLAQIRMIVAVNLSLGIVTILVGSAGRYLF